MDPIHRWKLWPGKKSSKELEEVDENIQRVIKRIAALEDQFTLLCNYLEVDIYKDYDYQIKKRKNK